MSYATDAARWRALTVRDSLANGQFVYTVKSTAIYCRPTCPARLARRANVGFYKTSAEAEAAGFRPCKRCKPETNTVENSQDHAVAKACSIIDQALNDDNLKAFRLQDLAANVGLTPRYFHKIFKDKTGMTPKEYAKVKMAEKEGVQVPVISNLNSDSADGFNMDHVDIDALLDFENDPTLSIENIFSTDDFDPMMQTTLAQKHELNILPQEWCGSWESFLSVSGSDRANGKDFQQLSTSTAFDGYAWDAVAPLSLVDTTFSPFNIAHTYSPSLSLSPQTSSAASPISSDESGNPSNAFMDISPALLNQPLARQKAFMLPGGRSTASLNDFDAMLMFDPSLAAFLVHDFQTGHPNSVL